MKKIREYYIPETDIHFIKYLEQFEHYQEAQRNRALSHVKNWRLAIDIGANIGLWSKDLSNFFDHLICFEPNKFCIDYLKKNIDLNKSTINSCALGSKNETKDLLIHNFRKIYLLIIFLKINLLAFMWILDVIIQ